MPEEVRIKNHRGDLLLHRACLFSADLDMIKSLVELYPESLKMTDDQKNLPVHLYYMRLQREGLRVPFIFPWKGFR